jgi:hypothetical protein
VVEGSVDLVIDLGVVAVLYSEEVILKIISDQALKGRETHLCPKGI